MTNSNEKEKLNRLTFSVIGAAMEVHKKVGPGLYEQVYGDCLALELESREIAFEREVALGANYKGHQITAEAYRLDFVVEDRLVVELKAVEQIGPVHAAQLRTYLRFFGSPIGLLINFNVKLLKDGVTRIVHHFPD